jgi:uncharacterized membrane protein YraQ (UPF0718 family)
MESILIIGTIVIGLTIVAVARGGPELAWSGYAKGLELAWSVLPNVALGFALAGLITVLVPSEVIGRLIGESSGLTGIAIASVAGMLTPGGPFLQFPLIAALAKGGAGVGPLAAYLTAWSLLSANRAIVWELPLLGGSFTAARWAVSITLPILVGLTMPVLMRFLAR